MKTIVDQALREEIASFYNEPKHITAFFRIHPINIGVSIRLIDFYFDQYCQYNYPDVHADWETEFKKHKKTCFDFYARGEEKILLMDVTGTVVESTWSQLNFFKWSITSQHFFPGEPDLRIKIANAHKYLRIMRIKEREEKQKYTAYNLKKGQKRIKGKEAAADASKTRMI